MYDPDLDGVLRTMNRVFHRLGFATVNPLANSDDDWDVLWMSDYPFINSEPRIVNLIKELKPHQRINHFHGNHLLVSKSFMSSYNRHIEYVLPGFRFPEHIQEFKSYVEEHPEARFLVKAKSNRGIQLVNESEIVYDYSDNFYQVFMEKPYIIDDRAMDFSVYVVIASIDPLRVYRYDQEIHLRFCLEPYYPFDPLNVDKYVVSNFRSSFFDMESLHDYNDQFGFSFKASIEAYLTSKGHNMSEIWRRVDDALAQLILSCEPNMVDQVRCRLNQ